MTARLPKPLRGIVPPMVTPLSDRDTLDVAGLERLVEHILGGGVHGLFVLGTTGEAPSLSVRLRRELVTRAVKSVRGRVPVLVGITDASFVESVNLARHAADAGADALVLAPPYYFPAGQPELIEYVRHLAPELPLPLFLYNMPSHTKLTFEPATLRALADLPGIAGLKDSSANMVYFHRARRLAAELRPDWSMLVGPEELLAETVLLGGHGGVCGGANLNPRLYVELYEAASRGDAQSARALHERVMDQSERLYTVGRHASAFLKGIKCALAAKGICDDFVAEPFHRFREPERGELLARLEELEN